VTRANGPLHGITILDLSRVLSGPYCTMLAADMGARVIKVEHPERGDDTRAWGPPFQSGESAYYLSVNRNKESIAIDFKTPQGREVLTSLAGRADAIVENFRPGTLAPAGLDSATLLARHPALIYVSISGFGQRGPRRDEPGYDAVAQAEGGLMSVTGPEGGPSVRLGVAIADLAAGMFAFQGLLLALIARGRTGRGQHVDISLLDSVTALLTYQASRYFATGEAPRATGNRHLSIAPYDTFDTSDGVLVLAVGNDAQWQRLCRVLGRDSWAGDPRFTTNADRVAHADALRTLLRDLFRTHTRDQLVARLRGADVPCGAVRSIDDALADPQTVFRDMIATIDHPLIGSLRVLGLPVKLSETPGGIDSPPPRLGEHTRQVLSRDLGVSDEHIDALVRAGAIRT